VDIVTCPTSRQITEFLRGETQEPLATELFAHISNCSRCSRSVQNLKLSSVRVQTDRGKSVDEISLLGGGGKWGPLDFLAPGLNPDEVGRLAHYRILEVLGEGGMGVVLHAEDLHLKRPVALKVIKPEFSSDQEARQRFIREARAMAQVKSDHVVTVYQVDQDRDVCFIAMELLEGESLEGFIEREQNVPLSESLRIGREISYALAAAHTTGLIHRDIKPANVWLEKPNGRVKLLDFGLARPQQTDVQLTGTGLVMGTPVYMAPEQARAKPLDARADLFSLGCLLYRMSCGQMPFQGNTLLEVMVAIFQDTPRPPSYYSNGLPKELDELIMHLLEKNPENRPESAHSVASELLSIEEQCGMTGTLRDLLMEGQSLPAYTSLVAKPAAATNTVRSREAEHRQVTVLICGCELFAAEDFIEHFDSSGQHDLLTVFYRTCEQAIRDFGGAVVQRNEEGVTACFGYPVTHEDSVSRAVNAALSIFESLGQFEHSVASSHKVALGPWIILNTGSAVAERKDDSISLVGEARNIAVRLKAIVSPGQLICTQATHKLLHGCFKSTDLGDHNIKSLSQPVALFQIHSQIDDASSTKLENGFHLTPLIGREHELSLLQGRWEQARDGMGQVVHLIGEAGLGKSRLVKEIKHRIVRQMEEAGKAQKSDQTDAVIVEWYASPHFQNTGFYPIINFFQRLLGLDREETSEAGSAKLLKHLEQYNVALPDIVALVTKLLGLPSAGDLPSLSPLREREEMFRAIKEWLQSYAQGRPLLLIVSFSRSWWQRKSCCRT
jgi:serine/threonine protein kinase